MKVFHLIMPLVLLAACVSSNYETKDFSKYGPLRSGFENPGGTARAKVYWWWLNGYTDTARIRTELNAVKEAGLGGVDIFEIGFRPEGALPPGPAFLSNESLKIIEFAIREATRLDLEVGLNMASSWNAGGTWITPEHSAKSLYRSTVRTSGGQKQVSIPFPAIEKTDSRGRRRFIEFATDGKPVIRQEVAILAIPVRDEDTYLDTAKIIDVNRYLDARADVLNWEVPSGEWQVSFDPQWGGPEAVTFPALSSWASADNEGIKYYSGSATYNKTFTFSKTDGDTYLDLGEVAEVADVWLNDHHLGITWTKPFRYNITGTIREGENELRIEVINTWSNRIVGDLSSARKFTKTNVQRGASGRSWSETPLLKSGLLGPVKISVAQSD